MRRVGVQPPGWWLWETANVTVAASLTRHGREVVSVFDLLGRQENDLTAALGFTLARSPELTRLFAVRLLPAGDIGRAAVRMETRDDTGRTDLEFDTGSHLLVVEAKRGWVLPGEIQLGGYAPRIRQRGAGLLVTLSDASADWARDVLPATVGGVELRHLSWAMVRHDLTQARQRSRGQERVWLDELDRYLGRAVKGRDPAAAQDQHQQQPVGGGHPFGTGGWPHEPPNFLALRWDGQVQRVHRVLQAEVIRKLQDRWSDVPETPETVRPHAVYRLGPQLPGTPVASGRQYRATRLWVLLDQLLSSPTLAEAITRTNALTAS